MTDSVSTQSGKARMIRELSKGPKVLLGIIQHPDERLHATNRAVGDFNAPGLKEFVQNMVYTIQRLRAVGLAAPQVEWNIKLAVAIVNRRPLVMFNPEIVEHGDEEISIKESCLSCGDAEVEVKRWNDIRIEYDNISGTRCSARIIGIDAIVVQHEIDHLNGKLIVD